MDEATTFDFQSPKFQRARELKFYIGDVEHTVKTDELTPETSLNQYIREKLHMTGTKKMCLEGGCGVCVVTAIITDPVTNRSETISVNSCLVPVYLASGWKIHTVETIGNENEGYHEIQKALVQFSGTQCGYCSPGMIMNMYALYESGKFTMADVDNIFAGNICRCTGYRPILSAFKSLASDASTECLGTYKDIEDIAIRSKNKGRCSNCTCQRNEKVVPHFYDNGNSIWYKVYTVEEILAVIQKYPNSSYMLVGGNTAKGVYHITDNPEVYIDITGVKTLLQHTVGTSTLTLGANMTLTNTMQLFNELSTSNNKFSYLKKLADHIDLIASTPIRNIGTLAGNLSIKHEHHEFPSDIFLILETVGAKLILVTTNNEEVTISLLDFLTYNMKGVIIKSIILPALDDTFKLETYKIMPRAQNAHALVDAGFLFKLNANSIVESASIVYGAINPLFVHALNAENYIKGKQLFESSTLEGLFETLNSEVEPDHVLPDPSPEFRKKLAIGLCYKFILSIAPEDLVNSRYISGGSKFVRPVSKGTQDFETNESLYPLTQPIPKIEALAQCSGKAQYIMDMPDYPNQLYAAFVLAKAAPYSTITKIDATQALALEGVEAFYTSKDIPGDNSFVPLDEPFFRGIPEEIFCSGEVKHYYQPLGLIVAKTQEIAEKGADLVNVSYTSPSKKALCTVRELLEENRTEAIKLQETRKATSKGDDINLVINGKFYAGLQYHYSMETQCCIAVPEDEDLILYPATQYPSSTHTAVAKALNIPTHKISMYIRRLGGAYGAKISRNGLAACAAALAAHKLNKPVKLGMPFMTNMNTVGKRFPLTMDYEVHVNENGRIQMLDSSLYTDVGSMGGNEELNGEILLAFTNTFESDTWNVDIYITKTDTQTNTWCRAPGTTEGIASSTSIMNHIAFELNLDPIAVYKENYNRKQPKIVKYLDDLLEWANINNRRKEIKEFNDGNRWVKKGMGFVPLSYDQKILGNWNVIISVYQADGKVAITHGGVEMGQGINTKVAQVCAHSLGIPLDYIRVKPTNTNVSPNLFVTGGSFTSEGLCHVALKACELLKKRMEPIKLLNPSATWEEIVKICYVLNIDLQATERYNIVGGASPYITYGSTCVEVEVDILTGVHNVTRVDIIEDTGNSMSPLVDIGQVEGAFIMGMGYWTSEEIIYGPQGELLTNRTWNYKPPGAKDIPIDFRVMFPKNNPNPVGVLNSKATGEPPLCMSVAVAYAIRDAVASARLEVDQSVSRWYPIDGPSTVENTLLNSLHDYEQFTLQ